MKITIEVNCCGECPYMGEEYCMNPDGPNGKIEFRNSIHDDCPFLKQKEFANID